MCDWLEFAELAGRLKATPRAGWARRGVPAPESVADHSFRLALLAWVLAARHPGGLDRARCVALALVHDLAEAEVGDITPHDGVSPEEKLRRERAALARIGALLGDGALPALWAEYAAGQTPEARFVKSVDKLETLIQAGEYARRPGAPDLGEFWALSDGALPDPHVRTLVAELRRRRGPPP